jgi:LmbE family N-acetylglucosaminyl deacetylase
MIDRQTEPQNRAFSRMAAVDITSALCIAPHPDDEILGCGGLLAQLAAAGKAVHTRILTRGECSHGEPSEAVAHTRMAESRQAAQVLGLAPPQFADFADRHLIYAEPLIADLEAALHAHRPSHLLLPSLSEPHPDHQAVALAGMAAAQRLDFPVTLLFYEVGSPLQANTFIDITAVAPLKWQAVAAFASQLGIESYEPHSRAFAALRAFGQGPDCTAAEAFFRVESTALHAQGASAAMPYWPLLRQQQQLANTPQQLPLVSVLVRSMDRPYLADAIASIAAQTYPHIEVVIVNASGRTHSPVSGPSGRLTVRLIEPAAPQNKAAVCSRSAAANLALKAAIGQLALFLDDDDLIAPHHLQRLVSALEAHPRHVAAYAGVRVEGQGAAFQRDYDLPWSKHRLNGINYLPIHAVLFKLKEVQAQPLRFDETLPVLEDWAFWRQLAQHGDMVHCPGISATYRQGHGDSGLGNPAHANHWQAWHAKLTGQFIAETPALEIAQTITWHAIELDRLQTCLDQATRQQKQEDQQHLQQSQQQAQALSDQQQQSQQQAQQHAQALSDQQQQSQQQAQQHAQALSDQQQQTQQLAQALGELSFQLRAIKHTRFWRHLAPLWRLEGWLRGKLQ